MAPPRTLTSSSSSLSSSSSSSSGSSSSSSSSSSGSSSGSSAASPHFRKSKLGIETETKDKEPAIKIAKNKRVKVEQQEAYEDEQELSQIFTPGEAYSIFRKKSRGKLFTKFVKVKGSDTKYGVAIFFVDGKLATLNGKKFPYRRAASNNNANEDEEAEKLTKFFHIDKKVNNNNNNYYGGGGGKEVKVKDKMRHVSSPVAKCRKKKSVKKEIQAGKSLDFGGCRLFAPDAVIPRQRSNKMPAKKKPQKTAPLMKKLNKFKYAR